MISKVSQLFIFDEIYKKKMKTKQNKGTYEVKKKQL